MNNGNRHCHLTDDASAMIAGLYRDGQSVVDIMSALGVSRHTVYHHLDRHGVKRVRRDWGHRKATRPDRLVQLMVMLSRPGHVPSFREMKAHLGVPTYTVQACLLELERMGYIRTNPGQTRQIDVLVRFVPADQVTFRTRVDPGT